MKKLVSGTFLILAFCFSAFGQKVETSPCQLISVTGPEDVVRPGGIANFKANVSGNLPSLVYKWSVSAGTIIEGQGTPFIKVDTSGLNHINIEAKVEVAGLLQGCPNTASAEIAFPVKGDPLLFDDYEKVSLKNELMRLTPLALELQKNTAATAIFIIFVGQKESIKSLQLRLLNISKYLTETYKIPKNQLRLVFGGYESVTRMRVYIAPSKILENTPNTYDWDKTVREITNRKSKKILSKLNKQIKLQNLKI